MVEVAKIIKSAVVESLLIADKPDTFVSRPVVKIDLDYGGIPNDRHFGITKAAGPREKKYYELGTKIANRRQISIVSLEELDQILRKFESIETRFSIMELLRIKSRQTGTTFRYPEQTIFASWLGANMMLSGFPTLSQLPPSSHIMFPSGAGLCCTKTNDPCVDPGEVIEKAAHMSGVSAKFPIAAIKPTIQNGQKIPINLRGIVCTVEGPGEVLQRDSIQIHVYNDPIVIPA